MRRLQRVTVRVRVCIGLAPILWALAASASSASNLVDHYAYTPQSSYSLTADADDAVQLVDGEDVKGHFWTSKLAVGWVNSGPITLTFAMREGAHVQNICVTTARGQTADVSYPERIDAFVGNRSKKFTYVGNLMPDDGSYRDGSYEVRRFCLGVPNIYASEVRVRVVPRGRFFFSDEFEITGNEKPVENTMAAAYPIREDAIISFLQTSMVSLEQKRVLNEYRERLIGRITDKRFSADLVSTVPPLERLTKAEDLYESAYSAMQSLYPGSIALKSAEDKWEDFSPLDFVSSGGVCAGPVQEMLIGGRASMAINVSNGTADKAFKLDVSARGDTPEPVVSASRVRMVYSSVRQQAVADVLEPTDGGDISILPGETAQIWLTIVANDAAPGNYRISVRMSSATDSQLNAECNLPIRILNAKVPDPLDANVNVWSYLNSPLVDCCRAAAIADLRDHFTNTFVVHPAQLPWMNSAGETNKGEVAEFRRFVESLDLDSRKGEMLLLYFGLGDPGKRSSATASLIKNDRDKSNVLKWIRTLILTLRSVGLSYRQFAFYPVDEPKSAADVATLKAMGAAIKEADSSALVFATLGKASAVDVGLLSSYVDIFQVLTTELSDVRVGFLKARGKQIWSYSAEGGGKHASPSNFYLKQGWVAANAEISGVGFWSYSDAGNSGNAWDDSDDNRPDFAVVYRVAGRLQSSKRWEAWAEGVQDFALLKKLAGQSDRKEISRIIKGVVAADLSEKNLANSRKQLHAIAGFR
jgi:hypothetical protein